MRWRGPILLAGLLIFPACSSPDRDTPVPSEIVWEIDNLERIGGHAVTLLGQPSVVDAPDGPAVEFDGIDDAAVLDTHPLAGATHFTAEVIFRPYSGGPEEQRFLHLQETGSKDRILFETRLTGDGRWFLDTYVKTDGEGHTLFARRFLHSIGPWYHAAIVVDGEEMRHYVNGVQEMARPIEFRAPGPGRTSLGMRINEVHWYRGAIRRARFTPRVLSPSEFLRGATRPGSPFRD